MSKRVDLSNQRHHEIASASIGTGYDISIKRIYHSLVLEKQKKEGRVLFEYEKKALYHKARDKAFYE